MVRFLRLETHRNQGDFWRAKNLVFARFDLKVGVSNLEKRTEIKRFLACQKSYAFLCISVEISNNFRNPFFTSPEREVTIMTDILIMRL